MKNTSKFIALLLMIVAFAVSSVSAKEVESIAAKVNNEPITLSEYNRAKNMLVAQYSNIPGFLSQQENIEKVEAMALEQLINEKLLRQKAKAANIKIYERELETRISEIRKQFSVSQEGKNLDAKQTEAAFREELKKNGMTMEEYRNEVRSDLMVRKLVQETLRPRIKVPSEEEVKKLFDNVMTYNKSKKLPAGVSKEEEEIIKMISKKIDEATAERVRLRHVAVSLDTNSETAAKTKIDKAYRELSNGIIDFDGAVERYSEDRESLSRYGDLGYLPKGSGLMPEDVEKVIFAIPVGGNSKPVKIKQSWHIFRVEEKRAKQKARFSAVREELAGFLSEKNYSEEYKKYVEELRKDAKIQNNINGSK